jgi:3-hydroxyisobutyrate dehydrogenase-like beta-hydroxyacid dehydrogenase
VRPAVGLVGCGNMGAAIAARLAWQVDLEVFDLDRAKAEAVQAACPVTIAAGLDTLRGDHVVLSLPTAPASASVLAALAGRMAAGGVVIETSTVTPADLHAVAPLCDQAGLYLVDAAILSGVAQMRDGTTTLLLGGSDVALAAAEPVLDALASRHKRLGGLGAGMAAKVANNAVSHAVMVVLIEAAAMADAAGVAPEVFAELLTAPDAGLLRPLTHRLRERVLAGDFEGGMPTEAALKDSALAIQLAEDGGVPLFAIRAAHAPYELAVGEGLGREDYAALARLWEGWTGRSLRAGTSRV